MRIASAIHSQLLRQFWANDWGRCDSNGDWSTEFSFMAKGTVLYVIETRRISVEKALIELAKTNQITEREKAVLSMKHGELAYGIIKQ